MENLGAAVNLHVAYFNFCWCPGEMRVTLAMAAGISGHIWRFDELLASLLAVNFGPVTLAGLFRARVEWAGWTTTSD